MKIVSTSDDLGDTVEVSVTHEIKIRGDKSWVGARISTKVRTNETLEDAHARADAVVQRSVVESIHNTVKTVEEMS